MLIYICDDSRADQLRLVHNIESYAKEKGAAVTVKLFSSADALLREYETSTEKPAVIFLDIYMDGTNGMDAAERLIELGMENGLVFTTSSEIHAVKAVPASVPDRVFSSSRSPMIDFVRAMKRFSLPFRGVPAVYHRYAGPLRRSTSTSTRCASLCPSDTAPCSTPPAARSGFTCRSAASSGSSRASRTS